jgi:hypothetical protein
MFRIKQPLTASSIGYQNNYEEGPNAEMSFEFMTAGE